MSAIRPILKRLHSPDVFDLDNPSIDENAPFCILVQAMFGPDDSAGEESFDLLVCNLKWIERKLDEVEQFSGRHHLIVRKFDAGAIRSFLEDYARECCQASTWKEVAEKLARVGRWEFEDYIERSHRYEMR